MCIKGYLTPYTPIARNERHGDNESSLVVRTYPDHGAPETNLFCLLMLACRYRSQDGGYRKHGLVLTPIDIIERLYRRVGLYVEENYNAHFGVAPESSFWIQGKFPVHLWAPSGEIQEVYIV